MILHKDITIGEHKYQIGRFTARVGSWMLTLARKGERLTEPDHENMQTHCLSVCSRYEKDVPLPILSKTGQFAIKDLEYDLSTVTKLQGEVMSFNFDAFLAERVEAAKAAAEALAQTTGNSSE